MPSVDNRVVQMQFDNAVFQQKINATLVSLASLEKALQFNTAKTGLSNLNSEMAQVNLQSMAQGVDHISNRFSALGAIGFSVIQKLTQDTMAFLSGVASKLLDPIFQGGMSRALAIEQAQFMFRGLGIDVDQAMASAKAAVLGTAYGLGDAAKAAAQFAASGIQVGDQMTSALRGVAGAAAMTGTSFGEIAYIFSGIAGANKVNSQDLMQFSTRGLNAAAAIAKAMGTTEQAVRDMVSNGEMDFATFAKYMDLAFGAHATQANETYTGSLANMKAAMSRLGAAIISPQLTNFRDIFNTLTPVIDNFTAAIRPAIDTFTIISRWVTSGIIGLIKGISFDGLKASMPVVTNAMVLIYQAMKNIWTIGKNVFNEIFPPKTVSFIQEVATGFLTLADWLQISVQRMWAIRGIFQSVFSALSIGWEIIKQGAIFLGNLGKSIAAVFSPGVSNFISKFGNTMAQLQDTLVKQGGIKSFFDGLTEALQGPLEWLQKVKDAISELFSGWRQGAADTVEGAAEGIGDKFQALRDRLSNVWEPFINSMEKIWGGLQRVGEAIGGWLKGLWDQLAANISSSDFNNLLDALNTALLGGIAALMAKFLKGGFNINFIPGIANIGGTLNQLTNSLAAMQGKIRAETLMKIAEAIALLTASVVVLSLINSEALTKALTAMSIGFAQLIGAFAAIEKLSIGPKGAIDFALVGTGMIILAGAITILSMAVKILSTMSWNDLIKGLGGTLVLLGALVVVSKPLSANASGMIAAGVGIQAMAVGLVIMSAAVKVLGSMSWGELVKGLFGLAAGLTAMVVAMRMMPNDLALVKAGTSLLFVATSVAVLAGAVAIFASMNWESMGKGLAGMAVSLGAVVLAMNLLPKDMGVSAGSILVIAGALVIMAKAVQMMGGLSWESLAKGLAGIAVSLGLMVAASLAMQAAIPGAGAMILVASALLVLAKAIEIIGKLSVAQLVTGLVGLAAGLAMIALTSMATSAAIPVIAGLGAALILLGAGLTLIAAAAWIFAKAIGVILLGSEELITKLPDVLNAIARSIPAFIEGLAQGVVDAVEVFIKAAPTFAKALGIVLTYLIDTMIKLMPRLMVLMEEILNSLIKLIYKYSEPLVEAGLHILISFLEGISNNIERIVTLVADIITKFLDAMANETPRVVASLVNTIATFFIETARGLGELVPTLLLGVGMAFIDGFITGMTQQFNGPVWTFITGIPGTILGWIGDALSWLWQKGVDIINGMLNGIVAAAEAVWNFFSGIPGRILGFFSNAIGWLVQAGSDILNGLKNGIEAIGDAAINWLSNIHNKVWGFFAGAIDWLFEAGKDVIQGFWDGLKKVWHKVEGWLGDIKDTAMDILGGPLGFITGSPSKVMDEFGQNVMDGMFIGMKKSWEPAANWLAGLSDDGAFASMNDNFTKAVSEAASKISDMPEFQPTITPVLDLTRVATEAGKLSGYLNTDLLSANLSWDQANKIAAFKMTTQTADQSTTSPEAREVIFQQTLNSPTPLSPAIVYKQTRNLITLAKEELSIP